MTFILGPRNPAISFIREVPSHFDIRNGVILTGWARRSGVAQVAAAMGDALRHMDVVVGMANSATSAEALSHLISLARRVFVYHKHHRQTFHPKVYLFDDGRDPPDNCRLLIGSSNLTGGGLFQNIEGNYATALKPSSSSGDRELYEAVIFEASELMGSPFSEHLHSNARILELLQDRYIKTDDQLCRSQLRTARALPRHGERRQMPEAPPPPLPPARLPVLETDFDAALGGFSSASPGTLPSSLGATDPTEQFYVRTLTSNDVNKLHGHTPGTPEWDIGTTARDAMPAFWGWPDEYERGGPQERLEWNTARLLRSSATSSGGTDIGITVWHRDERPGHAAEHRLLIRPEGTLRKAVPSGFDTGSLVVLERLPPARPHTFLVRFLTEHDPEHADYVKYLVNQRPKHRYGYGSG